VELAVIVRLKLLVLGVDEEIAMPLDRQFLCLERVDVIKAQTAQLVREREKVERDRELLREIVRFG